MAEETRQIIEHAQPYKIELTKGAKGEYRWTITVHAASVVDAVHDLAEADNMLRLQYEKGE